MVRVDNIISRLEESKKITLDTLEKQRLQYTDAFRRSSDIIQRAEEGIKIMKNNMENYRYYQSKGLINKDQLTNQVAGNDSNLLIVFYVQIIPDDFVMQLHRF